MEVWPDGNMEQEIEENSGMPGSHPAAAQLIEDQSMPSVQIDKIGGKHPVQAEGFIHGVPFYFRARSGSWSVRIGNDPIERPWWKCEGSVPNAGEISHEDAKTLIKIASERYAHERMTTR